MKRPRRVPVPQKEFGFTTDTFNLIQEWTLDGERVTREQERAERERQQAEAAQAQFFPVER